MVNKKPMIASALFLTFTVCLYAPLSIYITNNREFWFNLRTIWYVPTLFFAFALLCCIAIGLLTGGRLYKIWLGLLFGTALCFYIQGNFLGIKVGIMDGRRIEWGEYSSQMTVDLIIWILIVAAVTVFCVKTTVSQSVVYYASCLFILMQVVSLGVMTVNMMTQENAVSKSVPALTTKSLYEVGSDDNIIVFVLDAFDQVYYDYVKEDTPEILDEFDGFVYYENYTGVYPTTITSFTGMMSNKIFRNEMSMQEWVEDASCDRMYFDELTDKGYEIAMYMSEPSVIPQRIKVNMTNYTEAPMRFWNVRTCFSLLYRLTACQYFPDIVKPYVWMDGIEINSMGYVDSEDDFYNYANAVFKEGLENEGVTVKDGAKQFKFIHLCGTHEPYYTDEWGNDADQSWDWKAPSKGVLRIVSEYLRDLKNAGVYDRSTIIVTADHGCNGYPGMISNPIFMIKSKDEHHPIKNCGYEASHMNFGATVADLAGADPKEYGLSILDITKDTSFDRYYYGYVWDDDGNRLRDENGNFYLVEYVTANDTNDTAKFVITDNEYTPNGEKVPHRKNCSCCQQADGGLYDYFGWNCWAHQHIK